jgi:hypothetical protein
MLEVAGHIKVLLAERHLSQGNKKVALNPFFEMIHMKISITEIQIFVPLPNWQNFCSKIFRKDRMTNFFAIMSFAILSDNRQPYM